MIVRRHISVRRIDWLRETVLGSHGWHFFAEALALGVGTTQLRAMTCAKAREWACGVISVSSYCAGQHAPFHDVVWVNENEVRAQEAMGAARPVDALLKTFHQATSSPLFGEPHVPARVRVASPELALELGEALRGATSVVCAPTPELDEIAESMCYLLGPDPASDPWYLGAGVEPEAVAAFFDAAAELYLAAPWDAVQGGAHVLSLAISALHVRDIAVMLVGRSGARPGVAMFSSLERLEEFRRAVAALPAEIRPPAQMPCFLINFERGAALPPLSRKEIAEHGWRVATAHAYPWAVEVGADLVGRAPDETVLTIAEATARALVVVSARTHAIARACAGGPPFEYTAEVDTQEGPVAVTLRAPYPD